MANGGFFNMEPIPHVNGGLFSQVRTFELTGPELAILAEPAIFGTLFERSLDPEGATEADVEKRTLTNLYNAWPTWLRHAHAALDHAVWAACGGDDPVPAEVDEDTLLSRLLAFNGERAVRSGR